VTSLIATIVGEFGQLDIAHNNAGIEGEVLPLAEISSEGWRQVLDVNLSSVFYCLKAEINAMLAKRRVHREYGPRSPGLIGGYHLGAYTAAKHGVVGLTKCAAMDYGSKGIRINAVCPGLIDTPFLDEMPAPFKDRIDLFHPIGPDRNACGDREERVVAVLRRSGLHARPPALPVDGGVVLGEQGPDSIDLVG